MKITCIDKRINGNNTNYYIITEQKQLRVLFSGNGDLYFCLHNASKHCIKKGEEDFFEIDKDYPELYKAFDDLYNRIFGNTDSDEAISNFRSVDTTYLLKGNDILWHSDDYPIEYGDSMTIKKEKDSYRLVFRRHKDDLEKGPDRSEDLMIRISNSGSRYYPYNNYFMELYNKLRLINSNNQELKENHLGYQKTIKAKK